MSDLEFTPREKLLLARAARREFTRTAGDLRRMRRRPAQSEESFRRARARTERKVEELDRLLDKTEPWYEQSMTRGGQLCG